MRQPKKKKCQNYKDREILTLGTKNTSPHFSNSLTSKVFLFFVMVFSINFSWHKGQCEIKPIIGLLLLENSSTVSKQMILKAVLTLHQNSSSTSSPICRNSSPPRQHLTQSSSCSFNLFPLNFSTYRNGINVLLYQTSRVRTWGEYKSNNHQLVSPQYMLGTQLPLPLQLHQSLKANFNSL